MSDQTIQCPICNEPLEVGQSTCPRCGFKLIGETQTFSPIRPQSASESEEDAGATPALEVVKGPYAGEDFILGQGRFTIGRDPACDVFLSNMTVSRHHATIVIDGASATIQDENSLNGTWVDGKVVEKADLEIGTCVQIGTFDMVYKLTSK